MGDGDEGDDVDDADDDDGDDTEKVIALISKTKIITKSSPLGI